MIFDCPRCEAENAVPVSDIPEQGKVVTCVGCRQPFRVLPPDPDEFGEDETSQGDMSEQTAISFSPLEPEPSHDAPTGGIDLGPRGGAPSSSPSVAAAGGPGRWEPKPERGAIEATAAIMAPPDEPARMPQMFGGEPDHTTSGPMLGGRRAPSDLEVNGGALADRSAGDAARAMTTAAPSSLSEPDRRGPATSDLPGPASLPPDDTKGLGRRGRPRDERPSGPPKPIARGASQARAHPVTGALPSNKGPTNLMGLIQRAPLALKAAAVVFPIALVLFLLLAPGKKRENQAPIQLSAATHTAPPVGPARDVDEGASGGIAGHGAGTGAAGPSGGSANSGAAGAARGTEEGNDGSGAAGSGSGSGSTKAPVGADDGGGAAAARGTALPPGQGIALDVPAKEGLEFITADDTRLRTMAGDSGETITRLRAGALVRPMNKSGGSVLVMTGETGPAGFVPAAALSELMPISALAERHAFRGCSASAAEEIEPCSAAAKEQRDACTAGCTQSEPTSELSTDAVSTLRARCKQACDVAYSRCEHGCAPRSGRGTASTPRTPPPTPASAPPTPAAPQIRAPITAAPATTAPKPPAQSTGTPAAKTKAKKPAARAQRPLQF